MRIIIPSNDKIHISEDFITSKLFLVANAGNGYIDFLEIRQNPIVINQNNANQIDMLFNFLCDCQVIICRNIPKELSTRFKAMDIKVMKTMEENIRKAITNLICR